MVFTSQTVPPPREPPSSRPSPSTHQAQSSQWAAGPGTRSHTPGSHLWGQVRRRDSHTRGAGHTEDTRPRGTEPQKACGHGHTGSGGGGWQGQEKGGHWGHRPLTQRRVCTLPALGNVHIVLPRLHYRKARSPAVTQGPWADSPEFPATARTFNKTSQDSCTAAQRPPHRRPRGRQGGCSDQRSPRPEGGQTKAVAMERTGRFDRNW